MDHLLGGVDSMALLILVKSLAPEILSAKKIPVKESFPLNFIE